MYATSRFRTPLPARPAVSSVAIDATHRLLAALVDRDLGGAEALFAPSACVWWSQRGGLASVDGAEPLARALVDLLDASPPTKLSVVGNGARSTVTSAYVNDALAWSLELRLDDERIVGAYLRGARLAPH
jgi:hypothetical protein